LKNITKHPDNNDYWVVKLTANGVIEWQKQLGGTDYDRPTSIVETKDKGYLILGDSKSKDGDVNCQVSNSNDWNLWLVKLSPKGDIQWRKYRYILC
jgi:hypothetical protein